MYLLFQRTILGNWLFTGTFNSENEAFDYAKEYFGRNTEFRIYPQERVPLKD